jgi:hypothetical protein
MSVQLPDPRVVAQNEAQRINTNRQKVLSAPIDHVLNNSPQIRRADLLNGLAAFHRDRMARVPSSATYPESAPWVDHVLAVDRELKRLADLTDDQLAVLRSLSLYVAFRGLKQAASLFKPVPASDECCRVAYLPETDRGEVTIKNVDDPLTHWTPRPPPDHLAALRQSPLRYEGVGSGLHLDEEPDELFPLPIRDMLPHYAGDVPGAEQFLTRFCPFWGRQNLLLHDRQQRSVAIEKCSFKYMDVFHPGPDGRSHISGMTCRDAGTTLGRHQRAMQREYLDLFNLPHDGTDMAFWQAARGLETKLVAGLDALGSPARCADLFRLFTTRYPEGLNKYGLKPHPDTTVIGYTLVTHATLFTEGTYLRWQRSADGKTYATEPEIYRF